MNIEQLVQGEQQQADACTQDKTYHLCNDICRNSVQRKVPAGDVILLTQERKEESGESYGKNGRRMGDADFNLGAFCGEIMIEQESIGYK